MKVKRFEKASPEGALLMEPAEKQVEVGEFVINYATAGNGEPLLLLHGVNQVRQGLFVAFTEIEEPGIGSDLKRFFF